MAEGFRVTYATMSADNEELHKQYDEGIENKDNLWGIPVITTIKCQDASINTAGSGAAANYDLLGTGLTKENIIYRNEVFLFAPENWLGNFYLLQDATLFIKQEADLIQFWSYSAPGIGIGQTDAVIRLVIKDN